MSDSKTPTRIAKALRAARLEPGAGKPAAAVPKNAERIRGRHAAISNNFNNWRNYKEWAEKIRRTWEEKKQIEGQMAHGLTLNPMHHNR